MRPPTAPRHAAASTRDAILEAARQRFARFGPRKTTMAEVAQDAGCSRATVYLHFPGKDALYAGLLDRDTHSFLAEIESVVDSPVDAPRKLGSILRATLRIYADRPLLGSALAGDPEMAMERVARPAVREHQKRVVSVLRHVLDEGVEAGAFRPQDTGAVAYLMYQLGSVLVNHETSGRRVYALDRIMGVMNDLLAFGIAARKP